MHKAVRMKVDVLLHLLLHDYHDRQEPDHKHVQLHQREPVSARNDEEARHHGRGDDDGQNSGLHRHPGHGGGCAELGCTRTGPRRGTTTRP